MYIALIQNVSLLVALSALYSLLARLPRRVWVWTNLLKGLLFGAVAVIGMQVPFHYAPGIIYDGRSIILAMAGLFGGGTSALVSMVVAGSYRALLGGSGVWAGMATIVACTMVGLAFRHAYGNRPERLNILSIYGLGILTHVAMLACQLLLPWPTSLSVIGRIWLPVMLVFPAATVLMGLLLGTEERRIQSERGRQESEALLKKSQSIGQVGSWQYDVEADILTWTDETYRIFGMAPSESTLTYEIFLDCVHPEDRASVDRAYRKSIEEGRDGYEIRHRILRRSDSRERVVFERCEHAKDSSGRIIRSIGFVQDITETVEKEEALRRAKDFAENLIQTANVIFVQLDIRGDVVRINEAAEQITGYRQADVQGKSWFKTLVPRERYPHVWEMFDRITKNGDVLKHFENPILTKSGEERHIIWQNSVLRENDEIVGTISYGLDITERKRTEEALRVSEEKYKTLVENAHEVILVAQDRKIRFVNSRVMDMLGYTPEEMMGRPFNDFIHEEDRELVSERHTRRLKGEKVLDRFTFRVVSKEGKTRWSEISAVAIVWEGKPATLNFLTDVTEHKQLEEQLQMAQKLESVARLAGGVAHDFNNLLSIILGYGEDILDRLPAGDPLRNEASEILEAGKRAATLTRQLLAFSRKQTLQPEVLDINAVVRNLGKMLKRMIGEDIDLELKLSEDLGCVTADPGQIEQVIMNLAVNARDAMPKGGTFIIETGNVELDETYARNHVGVKPGKHVMLALTDTGSGMEKEVLSQIFDPFFTTKEKGKGTGLGLSTVYGIVKQSGGNIWVYSEPGQGTTFKIYLPQTEAKQEPSEAQAEEESRTRGGEHILVVEDEEKLRKLMKMLLSRLNYKVTLAANGGEALLLLEEKGLKPDLVITDVVMPGMDGPELVERLRKKQPDIKVLYMSGYTDNVIVHNGVIDAGTPYIQKPFSTQDISKKIQAVLRKRD